MVLLGDTIELRDGPAARAVAEARPLFAELADIVGGDLNAAKQRIAQGRVYAPEKVRTALTNILYPAPASAERSRCPSTSTA